MWQRFNELCLSKIFSLARIDKDKRKYKMRKLGINAKVDKMIENNAGEIIKFSFGVYRLHLNENNVAVFIQ